MAESNTAIAVANKAFEQLTSTLDFESMQTLAAAKHDRMSRMSRPAVVTVSPPAGMGWPGALTLYVAPAGSGLIRRIADATESNDTRRLEELRQELLTDYARREPVTAREAVRLLTDSPALLELRYGSKVLVENMGLPGGFTFGMGMFAYAGGYVDPELFSVIEYPRAVQDAAAAYDSLVLVSPPELSDLEKDLFDKLPAVDSELLVEGEDVAFTPVAATALLFIAAATLMHTPFIFGPALEQAVADHDLAITPDVISKLGDRAAVKELVNMRRKLFADLRRGRS